MGMAGKGRVSRHGTVRSGALPCIAIPAGLAVVLTRVDTHLYLRNSWRNTLARAGFISVAKNNYVRARHGGIEVPIGAVMRLYEGKGKSRG